MNIDQVAQNRPSLIVEDITRIIMNDLKYSIGESALLTAPSYRKDIALILMDRGVCKWMAARRDLIRLKEDWRKEIAHCNESLRALRGITPLTATSRIVRCRNKTIHEIRGRLRALELCRAQLRAICHSPRRRVPDNDIGFWRYLIP